MRDNTTATAPLPPEIVHAIIQNLSHDADRQTLLSTSRCSRLLCDESQRVLFRATTGSYWDINLMHESEYIFTHQSFLASVLASPHRLATYVHTYLRDKISLRHSGEHQAISHGYCLPCLILSEEIDVQLFVKRTTKALIAMVNLKRLELGPVDFANRVWYIANPGATLSKCSFKLESLKWYLLLTRDPKESERALISLLMAQPFLSDLQVPSLTLGRSRRDLLPIPNTAGLRLKSIWGDVDIYEFLRIRPKIAVIQFPEMYLPEYDLANHDVLETFHRIRYLSVRYLAYLRLPASTPLWRNVVLLLCRVSGNLVCGAI